MSKQPSPARASKRAAKRVPPPVGQEQTFDLDWDAVPLIAVEALQDEFGIDLEALQATVAAGEQHVDLKMARAMLFLVKTTEDPNYTVADSRTLTMGDLKGLTFNAVSGDAVDPPDATGD